MNTKYTFNTVSLAIFAILILGALTFFSYADDKNLTLFEDFDRDGLSNGEERSLGTNPNTADTDGDGYSDGVEIESGYDPLLPAPGDRIIKEDATAKIRPINSSTTNVTQKISESLVSYIADAQEAGRTDITSEDFSNAVDKAVDEEVTFTETSPIDLNMIKIKEQDFDDLSEKEKESLMKEDAIEYFTSISYIFMTSFPENFFNRSPDDVEREVMEHMSDFSASIDNYEYFEQVAKYASHAEKQMNEISVPKDLLDIHTEGLYMLRYMDDIYQQGSYKKAKTDATPLIATLAQLQGLAQNMINFQTKVEEKLTQYGIEESFLDL